MRYVLNLLSAKKHNTVSIELMNCDIFNAGFVCASDRGLITTSCCMFPGLKKLKGELLHCPKKYFT